MIVNLWLILSGLMYSLQLSPGSFPKPLTPQEEERYLRLASQGDLEARNILIERNLRLVSHIMNRFMRTEIFCSGHLDTSCLPTITITQKSVARQY